MAALRDRLAGTAAAGGTCSDELEQALVVALDATRPGDRVVVFGSFHTAGKALAALRQR